MELNHAALDRWITGNYGEDQFRGQEDLTFTLIDDGTLDTVLKCDSCGKELRYNIDLSDVEPENHDSNERRICEALDLATSEHECERPEPDPDRAYDEARERMYDEDGYPIP